MVGSFTHTLVWFPTFTFSSFSVRSLLLHTTTHAVYFSRFPLLRLLLPGFAHLPRTPRLYHHVCTPHTPPLLPLLRFYLWLIRMVYYYIAFLHHLPVRTRAFPQFLPPPPLPVITFICWFPTTPLPVRLLYRWILPTSSSVTFPQFTLHFLRWLPVFTTTRSSLRLVPTGYGFTPTVYHAPLRYYHYHFTTFQFHLHTTTPHTHTVHAAGSRFNFTVRLVRSSLVGYPPPRSFVRCLRCVPTHTPPPHTITVWFPFHSPPTTLRFPRLVPFATRYHTRTRHVLRCTVGYPPAFTTVGWLDLVVRACCLTTPFTPRFTTCRALVIILLLPPPPVGQYLRLPHTPPRTFTPFHFSPFTTHAFTFFYYTTFSSYHTRLVGSLVGLLFRLLHCIRCWLV